MNTNILGGLAIAATLAATTAHAVEFAPPGARLAIGESAVVPVRIPYGPQVPVRVTVTAIEEGTLADFQGFKLPPAAADMKPYYVSYTATALGGGDLRGMPIGYTLAVDDRNQLHTSSLAMGGLRGKSFERCLDGTFKSGDEGASYQGCRIFMLHKAATMKGFAFKEFETPFANAPVVWLTPASVASSNAKGTLKLGN